MASFQRAVERAVHPQSSLKCLQTYIPISVSPLVLVASVDAGSVEPDPLPVLETQIQVGLFAMQQLIQSTRIVSHSSCKRDSLCVAPAHEKRHVRPRIKVSLAEPGHSSSWVDTPRQRLIACSAQSGFASNGATTISAAPSRSRAKKLPAMAEAITSMRSPAQKS